VSCDRQQAKAGLPFQILFSSSSRPYKEMQSEGKVVDSAPSQCLLCAHLVKKMTVSKHALQFKRGSNSNIIQIFILNNSYCTLEMPASVSTDCHLLAMLASQRKLNGWPTQIRLV
jgi:hypothetical protein